MNDIHVTTEEIDALYMRLDKEAREGGYNLNPDRDFTRDLIEGLLVNQKRYGYISCPCRIAAGAKADDLDIICPCDYRDPDLDEFGMCYCALYVSADVVAGRLKTHSIPERRPLEREGTSSSEKKMIPRDGLAYPVWRCRVCGYLCARENPPLVCPVCKAEKERFERFI